MMASSLERRRLAVRRSKRQLAGQFSRPLHSSIPPRRRAWVNADNDTKPVTKRAAVFSL